MILYLSNKYHTALFKKLHNKFIAAAFYDAGSVITTQSKCFAV